MSLEGANLWEKSVSHVRDALSRRCTLYPFLICPFNFNVMSNRTDNKSHYSAFANSQGRSEKFRLSWKNFMVIFVDTSSSESQKRLSLNPIMNACKIVRNLQDLLNNEL